MTSVTWGLSLMALNHHVYNQYGPMRTMPFIPIDMTPHFNVVPLPFQEGGEQPCDDLTTTTLCLVYRLIYTRVYHTLVQYGSSTFLEQWGTMATTSPPPSCCSVYIDVDGPLMYNQSHGTKPIFVLLIFMNIGCATSPQHPRIRSMGFWLLTQT